VLTQMLRLLNHGGIHATDEIACQLGVSKALVAAMTDSLVQQGYLVALDGQHDGACAGCSLSGGCGTSAAGSCRSHLLTLTGKGRRIAEKE
jgi:hypothetical protein